MLSYGRLTKRAPTARTETTRLTLIVATIHGRAGRGLVGAGSDQSVRYPFDEIGSDVSTLLVPAVVLVATIGIIRIALSQPERPVQTATAGDKSRRTPKPPAPAGAPSPAPVTMTPAMPPGFQWMEAGPAPRIRSGLALVITLAAVGAALAVAVAAAVVAIASAVQGAV